MLIWSTLRTLLRPDGTQSLSEMMNVTVPSSFTRTLSGVRATSLSIPVPRVITSSMSPPRPSSPARSRSVSLRADTAPPAVTTAMNSSLRARNSPSSSGVGSFLANAVPKRPHFSAGRMAEALLDIVR